MLASAAERSPLPVARPRPTLGTILDGHRCERERCILVRENVRKGGKALSAVRAANCGAVNVKSGRRGGFDRERAMD